MADNITHPVTGTGTADVIQRTDDLGASGHVPYVKLMDGTDNGTTVAAVGANGLKVDLAGVSMTSVPVSGVDGDGVTPTVSGIGVLGYHVAGASGSRRMPTASCKLTCCRLRRATTTSVTSTSPRLQRATRTSATPTS